MAFAAAAMVPHPPLIVPQVGRGQEKQIRPTADACRAAMRLLLQHKPQTVVLISPHAPAYQDYLQIAGGAGAQGSLAQFGAPQVQFSIVYDQQVAELTNALAARQGLAAGTQGEGPAALDHASLVPLYFLQEARREKTQDAGKIGESSDFPFSFVRVGISGLPLSDHYRLGQLIAQAAQQLGRRWAVIASGDLSHYLKKDGPYGLRPEGAQYDSQVMDIMARGDFAALLSMPPALRERAGECGHRSFVVMAGCLHDIPVRAQRLSYQDVTGVGYGVCTYIPQSTI